MTDSTGTRLGKDEESKFDTRISEESAEALSGELKPTKLGQMSEFEKSLYSETTEEPKTPKTTPAPEASTDEPEMADLIETFADAVEESVLDIEEGDIVTGTVRSIERGGVLVDIGYKSDGFIPNNELSHDSSVSAEDILKQGDSVVAQIDKLETREGYTMLSRKKAEYELIWNDAMESQKNKDQVEVYVTGKVEGGLVVTYKGLKGFIPSSHLAIETKDLGEDIVGDKLTVNILHADRKRRKIVFTNRAQKNRPSQEETRAIIEGLEPGQIVDGRVTSIKDFGAFVDVGGVEGLVHISELSWARVSHPSDIIKVGQDVKVFILGVDKATSRISLGMKQLQSDPWASVSEKYNVGDFVDGQVSRITSFGAFMAIDQDLEGLVHISELSNDHVDQVSDVLTEGQKLRARIIKILPEEQKIGLSLREPVVQQRKSSALDQIVPLVDDEDYFAAASPKAAAAQAAKAAPVPVQSEESAPTEEPKAEGEE